METFMLKLNLNLIISFYEKFIVTRTTVL